MKKEGEYCQEDRQWGEEERKKKGGKSVCVCVWGWGGLGGRDIVKKTSKGKSVLSAVLMSVFLWTRGL